ncbi:MAG: serine hydrolase domain-containing protein [Pseudomonadota bacterium]
MFTARRYKFLVLTLMGLLWPLVTAASSPDIRDAASLQTFVDGIVNTSMRNHNIAGVVVVIMADDQLLVSKGYGFADVANEVPVDPAKTLFRIGSVSKLFTYIGLMQLYEQGKLDLDADIQQYLPNLDIPATFAEPIRVQDLFTHTAGFDERLVGLFSRDPADAIALQDILARELPARLRPPGEVSAYSNHSLGVAGLIIENLSGLSWADYVRQHILNPLEMTYATAHQPVPEHLLNRNALGYRFRDGTYVPEVFEIVPLAPAGSMAASGEAMAKFMQAHLHGGARGDARILAPDTLQTMFEPLYSVHASINSMAHGYIHNQINGRRFISHTGGMATFFTYWGVMPDDDVGIFVSTNTVGGTELISDLRRSLVDYYFPHTLDLTMTRDPSDTADLAGDYVSYRFPSASAIKFFIHMSRVAIASMGPGRIKVSRPGQPPEEAVEVEPRVFQLVNTDSRVYFDTNDEGQQRMFMGHVLASHFKLGIVNSVGLHLVLFGVFTLLLLWVLIAWPLQRLAGVRCEVASEHRSRVVYWLFSLVFFTTLLMVAANASDDVVFGLPMGLSIALNLAYLLPLLAIVGVYCVVRVWTDVLSSLRARVMHGALAAVGVVLSWQFYFWQFLGT